MWSNNKKVDVLINVLIFLVAINFFHYGQLILPIICLILFIDKKFKFKVNNIKIFVLLCLFGISFCIFSRNSGFFRVMGFCLPMAYYIGSNINEPSNNNIKKLIYIIAFGMAMHVVLNMVYSYYVVGEDILVTQGHYDIWLGSKVSDTATAVNYIFIIGAIYYVLFYEKKIAIKIFGTLLFVIVMLYDMFLGRRTPVLVFGLVFVVSLILDLFVINRSKKRIKNLFIVLGVAIVLVALAFIIYYNFLDDWGRVLVYYSRLLSKFRDEGLSSGRLEVLIDTLKLTPYHLWGGQEISTINQINPHDLLLDVYDHGGIITFVLLLIYVIYSVINVNKYIKNNKSNNDYRLLLISLFFAILMQLCLEPIMTGSSNFLMIVIIFVSVLEKVTLSERNN